MTNKIKPLLFFLVFFTVVRNSCAEVLTGNCGQNGSNVRYSLDTNTGKITISGSGDMNHYGYNHEAPWKSYKDLIKKVEISYGVKLIGCDSFRDCKNITSVNLSNSVEIIANWAFDGCDELESITIPKNVTHFNGAFGGCKKLKSYIIDPTNPEYISIDGIVFNKSKTELVAYPSGKSGTYSIPNTVVKIRSQAFNGCEGVTSVSIPNSVTELEYSVFEKCNNLTSIDIPYSVTKLDNQFFYGWSDESSLTSINVDSRNPNYCSIDGVLFNKDGSNLILFPVGKGGTYVIPNTVKIIGKYSFDRCSKITSITIPNSVTEIGEYAFDGCQKIEKLIIPRSVKKIDTRGVGCCYKLNVTVLNPSLSEGNDAFYGANSVTRATGVIENAGKTYYIVKKDGGYGLITADGRFIIPCEMSDIQQCGSGFLKFRIDEFWGVMNYQGKVIIPTDRGYTKIGNFVTFTKRFPYEMYGYKGECNNLGVQVSKIKVATPQPTTTTTSTNNNNTQSNVQQQQTIVVEHHRDPVPMQEWQACWACGGMGTMGCDNCGGSGTKYIGDRLHRCSRCNGRGIIPCNICYGNKGKYITVYK